VFKLIVKSEINFKRYERFIQNVFNLTVFFY